MDRRSFIKRAGAAGLLLSAGCSVQRSDKSRPNILLIMADDMGYSDLGCTGGEIETPNIDRLAREGIMMTRFYNISRCSPTRASLLTGLHPHQAGMGMMTEGLMYPDSTEIPNYQGYIKKSCATLAEVLQAGGYQTFLSGKWHVGDPEQTRPDYRGFERSFSLIWGASNYFNLKPFITGNMEIILEKDGEPVRPDKDFYMTCAITEHALDYLNERDKKKPFFMYLSYTAPHWPLHALPDDIDRYEGKYLDGWDRVRERRFHRMQEMGLIPEHWKLPPAYKRNELLTPDWDDLDDDEKQTWDRRMAVYAAMMYRMDAGIGRVLDTLEASDDLDNTLVLFLSDNGACPAALHLATAWCAQRGGIIGTEKSFQGYGPAWANVSNTPFRRFKAATYEGGIMTPLLIRWPDVVGSGIRDDTPGHIIDLFPTLLDAARVEIPDRFGGSPAQRLEGKSLLPVLKGESHDVLNERTLYWEHAENCAVRRGKWKLVYERDRGAWELYDMQEDGTECHDRASEFPEIVDSMKKSYFKWADRVGVIRDTDSLILARNADWF